jgi:AcrR family transcriptional regulator
VAGEVTSSRVERKRAERVRLVERTAARVFAENGYERANLEEIAAELNMRGPSLYYYFSSKEELFLRCVESSAAEVQLRLTAIAASDAPARERLRLLVREQVLIELRDYPEFVPLFMQMRVPVPVIQQRLVELRREHGDIFRKVADEYAAEREIEAAQTKIPLLMAFGALAYLPVWYDADGPLDAEEVADVMASTILGTFGKTRRRR